MMKQPVTICYKQAVNKGLFQTSVWNTFKRRELHGQSAHSTHHTHTTHTHTHTNTHTHTHTHEDTTISACPLSSLKIFPPHQHTLGSVQVYPNLNIQRNMPMPQESPES